jgi:hypothetical protein
VLFGRGIFDITDGAFGTRNALGDTLIALGADTNRPLDCRLEPNLRLPFRARLGEVIGEVVRRPRSVGAVDDGDLKRGKRDLFVQRLDRGIIPLGDLAREDPGESRPVENEIAGLDALDIDHRYDAAHDHRELDKAVGIKLILGSGLSDAPNVTALATICLIPPAEPID